MPNSMLLGLVSNIAILLTIALLFDTAALRWRTGQMGKGKVVVGLVLGGIGIVLMLTPWILLPGLIFDTRSVLLGISGLFFGTVPTVIAMVMTVALRIYQGGPGTMMGVSVIISVGVIGILWRHKRKRPLSGMTWQELYLFGLVQHIVMLLCAFILPWNIALQVLRNLTIPVLVIYPIGTALLGLLLTNRLRRERIIEDLQESEERLRLAVNAANIGFFERELQTNREHYSAEWMSQIGYAVNELSNDIYEWQSRVHPDDLGVVTERLNKCIEGHNPLYEAEYRLLHKDGNYRWILARGLVHFDAQGRADRLIGCHIDITQQKENEQRYRVLTESIQDVVWILDTETMYFRYVSPSVERLRGYSVEEVMSKPIDDALTAEMGPYLKEAILHRAADFLSGKEPRDKFYVNEVEQPCKDGSSVWTEVVTMYYINEETKKVEVRGVSRNIKQRKQTEKILRESEEKFRQIFETSAVGISLHTEDGKFISGNPATLSMLGYTLEEYCNLTIQDVSHPEDSKQDMQFFHELWQGKRSAYTMEKRNRHKDGHYVWGQLTCTMVCDMEGHPKYTIGMFADISERKKAEKEVETTQIELKHLLGEADRSRLALLSLVEDLKFSEEALTRLTGDLMVAYDSTLEGWSKALELRERETAGHSKSVVQLTLELSRGLGIDSDELVHIQRGALLHDIGKMGIPDSILLKPGPLTDDEWITMRRHPTYAYELLSKIPYLEPSLDIPYCHHERWDGSGYPRGLRGLDIPVAARIFAIVDVWDALCSNRPYRPAWPKNEVIQYLIGQSGRQFDPEILEKFLELVEGESDKDHL